MGKFIIYVSRIGPTSVGRLGPYTIFRAWEAIEGTKTSPRTKSLKLVTTNEDHRQTTLYKWRRGEAST